jgi:XTP/dITP diphosphohydrolase
MTAIWFASGNIHKKKELADILSADNISGTTGRKIEIIIPSEAGLEFAPEETGSTFLENALLKARELHRLLEEERPGVYKSGDPVIADDSGICVDALGGRPGIHSARYCGRGKVSGAKLDATERNELLLEELGDSPLRSARFVCAMVLYYGPDRFYAAQETMEGVLVRNAEAARGSGGFGYDPILLISELGRTVAELSDEEKNRLSHRGKAGKLIARVLAGL